MLHKVSNENRRGSLGTYLKPNSKNLMSTIASFLHSLDNHFESSDLELDMIIDLYKMIGYPGNINKTIFQPVGAPHTWPVCLQMMEWLAQLANFYFTFKCQMESN